MPAELRLIPLSRSLLPERQKNYDLLIEGRVQYGFSDFNLEQQEIMNLQRSPRIDILYNKRDCHFRPQIADTQSRFWWLKQWRRCASLLASRCWSWRVGMPGLRTCMSKCWQPRHSQDAVHYVKSRGWRTNSDAGPGAYVSTTCRSPAGTRARPAFQTYVHDKQPEPASVASAMFPEFRRRFCDDQVLRNTLRELAGTFGTALLDKLKQAGSQSRHF